MSKIFTADMKRRATYETLVRDTILEPKDKINLPDREATLLRNTQQLSKYDDDDFLNLNKDNDKITKERIQQIETTKIVSESPSKTITVEKATQAEQRDPNQFQSSTSPGAPPPPPPAPHPPSNPKFSTGASSSGHLPQKPPTPGEYSTASSSSGPPPPPPSGPKKGQAPAAVQQFDMTIDDDMDDMYDEYQKHLDEALKAEQDKKNSIAAQIQNHLGPHSSTADQSFVSRLVESRGNGKPPPPPPGAGAVAIPKTRIRTKTRSPPAYSRAAIAKPKIDSTPMAVEVNVAKPSQDVPPSGGAAIKKKVQKETLKLVMADKLKGTRRTKKKDENEIVVAAKPPPPPPPPPPPAVRVIPAPPPPPQTGTAKHRSRTPKAKAAETPKLAPAEPTTTPEPKLAPPPAKKPKEPRIAKPKAQAKAKARAKSTPIKATQEPIAIEVEPPPKRTASSSAARAAKKTKEEIIIETIPNPPRARTRTRTPKKEEEAEPASTPSRPLSRTPVLSRMSYAKAGEQLEKLVKAGFFNKADAFNIMQLLTEFNSTDTPRSRRNALGKRIKETIEKNAKEVLANKSDEVKPRGRSQTSRARSQSSRRQLVS